MHKVENIFLYAASGSGGWILICSDDVRPSDFSLTVKKTKQKKISQILGQHAADFSHTFQNFKLWTQAAADSLNVSNSFLAGTLELATLLGTPVQIIDDAPSKSPNHMSDTVLYSTNISRTSALVKCQSQSKFYRSSLYTEDNCTSVCQTVELQATRQLQMDLAHRWDSEQ